jgi:site-specific DNA recombinase
MKAITYARVSTDEQTKGFSISAQIETIREYCRAHKIKIVGEFIDAGFSAGTNRSTKIETPSLDDIKRPEFQKIRQFYKSNKVDLLVVWKQDRLSRDTLDMGLLNFEFAKYGVRLISITEPIDNPLMRDITSCLSAEERRKISERTKLGMKEKLRNGGWVGLAPVGYKNFLFKEDGKPEERIVIEDPEISLYIKIIFDLYCTGNYSFERLAHEMNQRGLKTRNNNALSSEEIKRILTNKFYIGIIQNRILEGLEVRGKHKPIISKTMFDRAQMVLNVRRSPCTRERKRNFLFNGLLLCLHCNHRLSGEFHKGQNYYGCIKHTNDKERCSMGYVPERELLPFIERFLESVQLRNKQVKLLEANLKKAHDELMEDIEREKNVITQKLSQLKKKKDALISLVANKGITQEDFNEYYSTLIEDEKTFEDRKKEIAHDYSSNLNYIQKCLELASISKNLYNKLDITGKKSLMRLIFKKIIIKDKKIESVELTPIYEWISARIEPQQQFRYEVSGVANGI